jgi:hypothetical protein
MDIIYKVLLILMFDLLAVGSVAASHIKTQSLDCESTHDRTFDLSKIDESMTKQFLKAWNHSHNGIDNIEAGLLIFQNPDGSYRAVGTPHTNQPDALTIDLDPDAIAIVHTHPNKLDPKPSAQDMRVADGHGMPILTITSWGMYMYDPCTKKVTKIQNNLDWLSATKFKRNNQ